MNNMSSMNSMSTKTTKKETINVGCNFGQGSRNGSMNDSMRNDNAATNAAAGESSMTTSSSIAVNSSGSSSSIKSSTKSSSKSSSQSSSIVTLTHYSKTPLILDYSHQYDNAYTLQPFKPNGLWLSDDSQELNWKTWCEGEGFRLEGLSFKTQMRVDMSNDQVLHLDASDICNVLMFQVDYQHPVRSRSIDWNAVARDYKGILITPYCYGVRDSLFRCDMFLTWFSGWDAPSACIWDLSCVVQADASTKVTDIDTSTAEIFQRWSSDD